VEKIATVLAMKDTSKKTALQVQSTLETKNPSSFTEAQRLLKICLELDDQLWSMTQSQDVSADVKSLW